MRRVCRGWGEPRHPLIVFSDDGLGGLDSDTICLDCRDYMKAMILKQEERRNEHS